MITRQLSYCANTITGQLLCYDCTGHLPEVQIDRHHGRGGDPEPPPRGRQQQGVVNLRVHR